MNSLYPLMEKHEEREGEDTNLKLYIFSSNSQVVAAAAASSSPSASSSQLAFATCFSTSATQHDHQRVNLHHHLLQESHHQLQHDHHQAEKSIGGSREDRAGVIFSSTSLVKSSMREAFERSRTDIDDHQEQKLGEDQINKQDNGSAAKYWMSSKMRLMQKMMKVGGGGGGGANSDEHKAAATRNNNNEGRSSCNSNGHNNNGVRVCSDCNTTTTPLWRSGPQGPKSLCNACGIRQRKARRAMAEAANCGASGRVVVASEVAWGKEVHKEKKPRLSCHGDGDDVKIKCNKNMRKNCSDSQSEGRNDGVSFDGHNFTLRLSKSGSAFGRVFPRDEEEAAILLMELSYGFVHFEKFSH